MPVQIFSRKKPNSSAKPLQRCVEALLAYTKRPRASVEVSLVGRTAIQRLNKKYRQKDRVTDVLSFPLDARAPKHGGPWHLGEIVICVPVAAQQAKRAARKLSDQLVRLAVHGLAHLGGLDHEAGERQRRGFERLERKWLAHLSKKRLTQWDGSLPL